MSSEKPDQIQASVAAALSRLRGDLGPSGATAPKIEEPHAAERAKPANDVRGDPFFRSIQSPQSQLEPAPGAASGARAPIPMTPFPRLQATQEPASPISLQPPEEQSPPPAEEPPASIDMPEMPERTPIPDLVAMPEPRASAPSAPPTAASPAAPQAPTVAAAAPVPGSASPLSRVMRGNAPAPAEPAQRDLLAGLPPPPISEPLSADNGADAARRRRRNRRIVAAAAAALILAVGAWLWSGREPSTEVPVIAAESTPEKVKPADEGGLQVQNQDVQVLDPTAQAQGETVLPEPEQPITPPAATATDAEQAPTIVESGGAQSDQAATAEAPAIDAPPAPEVPLSATPLPEPEENASAAASDVAPPAPAVSAPQPAPTTEAPAAESAPAPSAAAPAPATEPAATEPAPAEPAAAQPTETQEAAVTPVAPATPTGNTRVQLAAGKSEASVQKAWAALQKAHPDLLGNLSLTIERVDKGTAGIFYRLQAGPLADKAAARQLCASLKAKGQDCIVVAK